MECVGGEDWFHSNNINNLSNVFGAECSPWFVMSNEGDDWLPIICCFHLKRFQNHQATPQLPLNPNKFSVRINKSSHRRIQYRSKDAEFTDSHYCVLATRTGSRCCVAKAVKARRKACLRNIWRYGLHIEDDAVQASTSLSRKLLRGVVNDDWNSHSWLACWMLSLRKISRELLSTISGCRRCHEITETRFMADAYCEIAR